MSLNRRILVVDDDPVDRVLLTHVLARVEPPYDARPVSNAKEALRLLREEAFTCVLLDYHLGTSDSLDVLSKIGGDLAQSPVVVLSGQGDELAAAASIKSGAKDYLVKEQLSPTLLDQTIRHAIAERNLERQVDEQQQHLDRLAHHDGLTGLLNRNAFVESVEQALLLGRRARNTVALLFIDLDRFKFVNDTFGHDSGDELLQCISGRITASLREEDVVGRMGGDEFAVLMYRAGTQHSVERVAEKLIEAIAEPVVLSSGFEAVVSGSVGIAFSSEIEAVDADNLLKQADAAMYESKRLGRNQCRFFTPAMNANARARQELRKGLHTALVQNQFEAHYQPQYLIDGQTLAGYELLLRWRHPTAGLVAPGQFLPILEETGLSWSIGRWTVREACRQRRLWQDAGHMSDETVAVNVSARQLPHQDFIFTVQKTMAEFSIEPQWLQIEITEDSIIEDADSARKVLTALADTGVSIAVDDFGTGFSSLRYLVEYPVDTLKIDRSFVQDAHLPVAGRIIQSVCALSHSLELTCIAEGIETRAQWEIVRGHGCDQVQGFLFGHPDLPT